LLRKILSVRLAFSQGRVAVWYRRTFSYLHGGFGVVVLTDAEHLAGCSDHFLGRICSGGYGHGNPGPDSSHGPHGVRRNPLAQFGQLFNNYNAGNFYYNGLCQNITVGTGGGAFTGYAWAQGDELRGYVEDMAADVTGTSAVGMTLSSILYMENVVSPSSSGDSAWRPITFTVPGGAQTLFIGMWTKSGESATSSAPPYSSYWWLDSLAIH
jgi:hypothetical protein